MPKRQDAHDPPRSVHRWLLFLLLSAVWLGGCQPKTPAPSTSSPTETELPAQTDQVITSTPTTPATTTPSPVISPTPDCFAQGGSLETGSFYSELLDDNFHFLIYLPPCYQPKADGGYPTLYLLHGLFSSYEQWAQLGLVQQMDSMIEMGDLPPFIVILPDEAVTEAPQTSVFPDALTEELIPWVDAHYATQPNKAARAIGGISRGAAWAVHIGFDHPDLFHSIGAHSLPLFQADAGNITRWLAHTPGEELPRVFIDIGREDQEWKSAQEFADLLNANFIPHEWYLFMGGHTAAYWSSHLEFYLRWYARDW